MISRAAIIGAGLMGCGIARHLSKQQTSQQQKVDVVVIDNSTEQIQKAASVPENSDLRFSSEINDLKDRDFVIEAVYEDLSVKQNVLKTIAASVSKDCIIATNTSSLLVGDLAGSVAHPERFVGVHYNNPADMNPVVEIIGSEETRETHVTGLVQWMNSAGKLAVRCADTPCFILNRQSLPYLNEAARCLTIATPGEIDFVATSRLGVGLGPFAIIQLVGLPVVAAASRNLSVLGEGYQPAPQLQNQKDLWPIETVSEVSEDTSSQIVQRLQGAMMFPANDILEHQLCGRDDLHNICVQALGYKQSSPELLETLAPSVRDEQISNYLSQQI